MHVDQANVRGGIFVPEKPKGKGNVKIQMKIKGTKYFKN